MKKRVFIVEDEIDFIDLYTEIIELSGHNVAGSARNGQEAIEALAAMKQQPDIILMDHRMPVKNGLQTARELLKINPSYHIVFMSADRSVEDEARAAGAKKFFKKPMSVDDIIRCIEAA